MLRLCLIMRCLRLTFALKFTFTSTSMSMSKFNIASMVTQMQAQIMGLNPLCLCCYWHNVKHWPWCKRRCQVWTDLNHYIGVRCYSEISHVRFYAFDPHRHINPFARIVRVTHTRASVQDVFTLKCCVYRLTTSSTIRATSDDRFASMMVRSSASASDDVPTKTQNNGIYWKPLIIFKLIV